jgi:hypothetical protein
MTSEMDLAQKILLRGRHSLASLPQLVGEMSNQRDQALTGTLVSLPLSEPAYEWSSILCRSTADLMQALQWSTGLSGGLGPIPLLRVRNDFFESLRTTLFSVSLVVQARKVLAAISTESVTLKPDVQIPSNRVELDAFVTSYGDCWVQSVLLGGQIQGIYTLYAQSHEKAQEISTALDFLISSGTLTIGPSLSTHIKSLAKDSSVNVSFRVSVSGLTQPPQLTENNIENFASLFGSRDLDSPVVLSLQSLGYEAVPELHERFQPIARNRILLSGQELKPSLRRQWQRLREVINQCTWIEDTYRMYGIPQDPTLALNREMMRDDCRLIEALCADYLSSPSTPLQEPALTSFVKGSPCLQVVLRDGEAMGGGGGHPFGYENREHAIRRRRRLVRVGLRVGNRIDQIRLRYHQEPVGAPDEWINEKHGRDGGSELVDLQLGSGVRIDRIRAQSGVPNGRVDQLELTTTDGQHTGGGSVYHGDTPLDWHAGVNQVLLGFYGRSDKELDSLTAIIATFEPLAWEPVSYYEEP